MGHLVCFAAIRGLEDTAPLHSLDSSLLWRAYKLENSNITLLDWLRRPNRNNPPPLNEPKMPKIPEFCAVPSGKSFPESFGRHEVLDEILAELVRTKRRDTFLSAPVHVALKLNEMLRLPVLSVCSDDEGVDMFCEVLEGEITDLTFEADHQVIHVAGSRVDRLEISYDEKNPRQFHRFARQGAVNWDSKLEPLFGLDGEWLSLKMQEVDKVIFKPEPPSPNSVVAREARARARARAELPFWKRWF